MRQTILTVVLLLSIVITSIAETTTINNTNKDKAMATPTLNTEKTKGGVCFTFDDRNFDNWIKTLPLFDKYNVRATFFICGNLNNQQLDKIRKLKSHGHAIGCHSIKHLRATEYTKEHGIDKYMEDEIYPLVEIFKKENIAVSSFAYPCSSRNKTTDEHLLKIFRHLRTGGFIKPGEQISDKDSFFIKTKDISKHGCFDGKGIDNNNPDRPDRTFEQITGALQRAAENDELIVLYAHNITNAGKGNWIDPIFLEKVIKKAQSLNLKFYSFDDLP